MASPLGKLLVVLGVDARELTSGLSTAEKAVAQYGFSTKTAFTVIGAGIAGGFGAMTKFAVDSQEAQGKFQAATGQSREAAQAFVKDMDALAGTSGAIGRSFAEITSAGTAVANQFGLTGKAGQTMTENFLQFAKVTGSDATQAVDAMDQALKAFGEPAARAGSLMDQLVVSHQKYGTEAGPEALGILQSMAPALQAMGMGLNSGVGLLNAFHEAGFNASAAQRALNTAVKNLPPGTNLDDIIARLGAIEDPAKRAQEAIKIFGARAGVGLANVIKPGMKSLDEFIPSIEGTAGATSRAADAMVTDADKIRGAFDKLQAGLRDVGTNFGPLLSGLAGVGTLASTLAPQLAGVWTKLGGDKLIQGAIASAGAIAGTVYGTAVEVGHKIIHTMETIWNEILQQPAIQEAVTAAGAAHDAIYAGAMKISQAVQGALVSVWTAIGKPGSGVITAATGAGTASGAAFIGGLATVVTGVAIAKALQGPITDAFNALFDAIFGQGKGEGAQKIVSQLGDPNFYKQAGTDRGAAFGAGVQDGVKLGPPTPVVLGPPLPDYVKAGTAAGTAMGEAGGKAAVAGWIGVQELEMRNFYQRQAADAAAAGNKTGGGYSDSYISSIEQAYAGPVSKALVDSAHAAYVKAIDEAAWGGAQTPRAFADGARSAFGDVTDAFKNLRDLMRNTLSPAEQEAKLIGIATSRRLAKALADGRPEVRGEAQQIALDTIAELHKIDPQSSKIGELATKLLASALPNERPALQEAINSIVNTVTGPLSTLPGDATHTGNKIVSNLTSALRSGRHAVYEAAYDLARTVSNVLRVSSPSKEGPFSVDGGPLAWMDRLGFGMSRNTAAGIRRGLGELRASAMALANAATPALAYAPALGGTLGAASTVHHEGTVRHIHEISERSARNLRSAGFSANEVAHIMAAVGTETRYQGSRFSEAPRY
jgi:hypothetical protein